MAKTILTTAKGSSVGPYSNRFNVEVQIAYEGVTATGYNMYVRYRVNVTANPTGSTFTNNLHCSWTSTTYSLGGGTGYQVDSGWISLGEKTFGTKVSQTGKCYYNGSSGTYTSEVTASYTVPYPTYTISYDGNGGTGEPESQTYTYKTDTKLSTTVPKWEGHNFLGWALDSDATVAAYAPGDTWSGNNKGNYTLYAVWIEVHSIIFDGNGGTISGKESITQTATNNALLSILPVAEKEHHAFIGWNDKADGSGVYYQSITLTSNLVLYAIYEPLSNCYVRRNGVYVSGTLYKKSNGHYYRAEKIYKK